MNDLNKWMRNIENVLIEIGKNPEKRFSEETETFNQWTNMLEKQEKDLEDLMVKIEKWFEG